MQQSQDNIASKLEGDRFTFDKIQRYAVKLILFFESKFPTFSKTHVSNDIIIFFKQKSEGSSTDKDSDEDSGLSHKSLRFDTVAATFLDVAVLRCLFILHWQEEGVYWCLHYIYNRYGPFQQLHTRQLATIS